MFPKERQEKEKKRTVCFKTDTGKERTWDPFQGDLTVQTRDSQRHPHVVYQKVMDNSSERRHDAKKTIEFWTTRRNVIPFPRKDPGFYKSEVFVVLCRQQLEC
jgi:hypothetical protein